MCNEKIEIHVAANAVRPCMDASVLSNHGVVQEGYQLCSALAAQGRRLGLSTLWRADHPALRWYAPYPPSIPRSVAGVRGQASGR